MIALYPSKQAFIDDMNKLGIGTFKIDEQELKPMEAIRPMRSRPFDQLDFRECPGCGALVFHGGFCGPCKEETDG